MLLWRKGSRTPKPGLTQHMVQQTPTHLHLAEQGPLTALHPNKMLGLPILPGNHHVGHTLPVSSHHACSCPAGLAHPGQAPTHTCEAKPGAKAPLGTTPAE